MVIEFILCMLTDLSIKLCPQISLFVVANISNMIFLRGRMSRISKFVLYELFSHMRIVLYYFVRSATD